MPVKTCPSCRSSYPAEVETCPQDGSALDNEGWGPRSVVLGKYAVLRRVGEDEVSICYRVRVLESGEFRTLRVLRSSLSADVSAVREFRRVGRALQKVVHPNVLRVESVDQAGDGRPFLITEFVEAPSVAETPREGKTQESKRVLSIARGILSGLDACHRLGLLHLTLQPRNVLVEGPSEDLQVKVQGFETAHVWAARPHEGFGPDKTPLQGLIPAAGAYSSPEQVLARSPESLDARSDLYSLGLLMYEMLAGRLPFGSAASDNVLACLAARLEEAPAAMALGDGYGIPQPLIELVMQLLERRPELRPATARVAIEKIAAIEGTLAARSTAALELPPRATEPVAVPGLEEIPVAVNLAAAEQSEPVPAPVAADHALDEVEIEVPASEAVSATPSGQASASSAVLYEAPAPPESADFTITPPQWTSTNSVLFRTEPLPSVVKSNRWIWAVAAALVLAVGTALFIHLGGLRWQGPGPLSPLSSDQVHTVMGEGGSTPGTPGSQSGAGQQPSPNSTASTAPASPGNQNPPLPAEPSLENQTTNTRTQQQYAEQQSARAARSTTPQIPAGVPAEKSSPAPQEGAGPARQEGLAEVNRAVAAGDVFFELGQYDLAVRTYEGPLKLDPNNKLLRSRIDRALKAKAAEQQFLGQ